MSEADRTKRNQCRATRRDGQACTAPALGSGYCFAHDPNLAEKRTTARQQGGKNRAGVVRLRGLCPPRLVDVFGKLETALTEVHTGTLDPKRASAMAAIARAMVAVLTAGDWEERFAAINQRLAELEGGGERWRA